MDNPLRVAADVPSLKRRKVQAPEANGTLDLVDVGASKKHDGKIRIDAENGVHLPIGCGIVQEGKDLAFVLH